jgi:hypothetical protein
MAAGATDGLWEIVDVVEVLEAFEAKRKRSAKTIFEIERWAIGGGYDVRATLPAPHKENEPQQGDVGAQGPRLWRTQGLAFVAVWHIDRENYATPDRGVTI